MSLFVRWLYAFKLQHLSYKVEERPGVCGGSSMPFVGQWAASTAPAISTQFLRITADPLVAAIAPVSSKEVGWASASELLVLVASVQGVVVSDHDVEVAATLWVPRLALCVNHTITVNDTDVKALHFITIWCLGVCDSICRAYRPSISAELRLVVPPISDWYLGSSEGARYLNGLWVEVSPVWVYLVQALPSWAVDNSRYSISHLCLFLTYYF